MPGSTDSHAGPEASTHRQRAPQPAAPVAVAAPAVEGMVPTLLGAAGGDFSQATFERHARLLGDSRLSQRANAGQRAQILQRLQRDYGNQYVQRLAKHITLARTTEAAAPKVDPSLDRRPGKQRQPHTKIENPDIQRDDGVSTEEFDLSEQRRDYTRLADDWPKVS